MSVPSGYEFNMKWCFSGVSKAAYGNTRRKANVRANFLGDGRVLLCLSFGGKARSVFVKLCVGFIN